MGKITTRQFFDLILPTTGFITLATPFTIPGTSATVYAHHKFDNTKDLLDKAAALVWGHNDVFYALGSFRAMEVWNPKKKNRKTGELGANEFRTQTNSLAMKCFFLDLDIDPNATDSKHFPSKPAAVAALRALCKKVALPKPMLVDSGGGLHAYWPLSAEVPTSVWKPAAENFKAICLHEKLPIDPTVPADSARVLRVPGSANFKKDTARMVSVLNAAHGPYAFEYFDQLLTDYVEEHGVVAASSSRATAPRGAAPGEFGDNIGATNDPANFDRVAFHCAQIADLQATRGATAGYELWRSGLGIAKFCEPQREAALAISDQHPEFVEADTLWRMDNWNTPPTSCAKFNTEHAGVCDTCPHHGAITTPLQLGKTLRAAPAPVLTVAQDDGTVVAVELPEPPEPYIRTAGGSIAMVSEDKDGKPVFTPVCPNDLYPIRILRQTGVDSEVTENSMWRMHLDRMAAPVDIRIEQGLLSDKRGIHKLLLNAGLYVTPTEIERTQQYMSAYIRHLSKQVDREKIYERLGWHDDRSTFVIGAQAVHADGTITQHEMSPVVKAATKFLATSGGVGPKGTLDGWHKAMQFYLLPNSESHRVFMYLGFMAPLLHMTGHKGVVFSATGDSGRGKTTAARAQHSIWGHPESLMINGNKQGTTVNALYATISVIHSLGVSLDDTTDQDPGDMAKLMLNYPQGMDKVRMSGHSHDGLVRTWEQPLTITTNADDITRISAHSSGAEPHMMRVIPVEFATQATDTESKIRADEFKYQLETNHGHAGVVFMQYVMPRYAEVQARVRSEMARIDRLVKADSAERYWTAGVAAIYVAVIYAQKAGLLAGFPIESDLKWLLSHVDTLRTNLVEARVTPLDVLNNFLDARVGETLAVSAKSTTNLDNIALHPHHALSVRCDLDGNTIYVARPAMVEYCNKTQANFRKVEAELYSARVITNKNCQKVLGANTSWHRGQVRCWVIDARMLGGTFLGAVQAAAATTGGVVVPMKKQA